MKYNKINQMNSFWPQKQQINCTCFNVVPKNERKIFRSDSYYSSSQLKKEQTQHSIKSQNEQNKSKKKSLKKQKNISPMPSQKYIKEKQESNKQFIYQAVDNMNSQSKKIQKTIIFDYFDSQKDNINRTQRIQSVHSYRLGRGPSHINLQPINYEAQKVFQTSKNRSNLYFQQIVTKQLVRQSNRITFNRESEQAYSKTYLTDQKTQISKQGINKNIQKFRIQNINKKSSGQTPQKSYRSNALSSREKQISYTKKANQMQARQIQSQDDGIQVSSDEISEVVGRGWDGLTEQRLQIEELNKMNERETYNAETMVTHQSNIQTSEIKTFTDYSSSFISPKSQKNNMLPFGGCHKYGVAGMSYQNIDDLGRRKGSCTKINFKGDQ